MHPNQEIEAKFTIVDPDYARKLATSQIIAPGFVLSAATEKVHLDVYYDTPDYLLLNSGLGLRVRTVGERTIVTAKGIASKPKSTVLHRIEIECEVEATMDAPPYLDWTTPELQQAVSCVCGDCERLAPILVLHQKRTKRIISTAATSEMGETSTVLAELSIDQVRVLQVNSNLLAPELAGNQKSIAEFYELETELLPGGDYDRLLNLTQHLSSNPGLQASGMSKLETGLRASGFSLSEPE